MELLPSSKNLMKRQRLNGDVGKNAIAQLAFEVLPASPGYER